MIIILKLQNRTICSSSLPLIKASLIENICCPPFSGFKYSERREEREIGGDKAK